MYKTILVAIDLAHMAEGKNTLDYAISNRSADTRIILLHVVEEIPNWAAVELPGGLMEQSIISAQEQLDAIARASGGEVQTEVRAGHAHNTILKVAEEENADLIVVASHKPGLQDYFLGSNAAKVVRHANCSVLVVR